MCFAFVQGRVELTLNLNCLNELPGYEHPFLAKVFIELWAAEVVRTKFLTQIAPKICLNVTFSFFKMGVKNRVFGNRRLN